MSRKAVDLTLSSPIKIKELNNMSARLMAIVWLTSSLVFLSGCEITNTQTQGESALNVPSQPDSKTN